VSGNLDDVCPEVVAALPTRSKAGAHSFDFGLSVGNGDGGDAVAGGFDEKAACNFAAEVEK
jgi:hypothetical protein